MALNRKKWDGLVQHPIVLALPMARSAHAMCFLCTRCNVDIFLHFIMENSCLSSSIPSSRLSNSQYHPQIKITPPSCQHGVWPGNLTLAVLAISCLFSNLLFGQTPQQALSHQCGIGCVTTMTMTIRVKKMLCASEHNPTRRVYNKNALSIIQLQLVPTRGRWLIVT